MGKRNIQRTMALVGTCFCFLLLNGCTSKDIKPKTNAQPCTFAADSLGLYYVTQENAVCFIPFSEERATEYGHEIGILNDFSDITSICAEGNGYIGAINSAGTYHTTCDIQPEHGENFVSVGENIGAGYEQLVSIAQNFAGLSDISFFRSAYPIWGLFVHRDGTITIPSFDEESKKTFIGWENVAQLAGSQDVIALTVDGTILCMPDSPYKNTYESWADISALYSDYATDIFAVTNKGNVLFSGENRWGEGDVENWHNIVSIAAAPNFTVGLCSDGTVVAVGLNDYGQCNVADWTDIIAVAVSSSMNVESPTIYTAGLDRFGNIWVSGVVQGVSYDGIYMECVAQDYLSLDKTGIC